jgi:hypothetical protein
MIANCAGSLDAQDNKWLIDSTASHNITGDLQTYPFILNMTALMRFFLVMVQVWQLHILGP